MELDQVQEIVACCFDKKNLYKPLPLFAVFLARPKSPYLPTEMKCCELIPEASVLARFCV